MKTMIRPQAIKVSLSGLAMLAALTAAFLFLVESTTIRMIGLFAGCSALVILLGTSFASAIAGGLEVADGRIEACTGLGGVVCIHVDELDRVRSRLTDEGLELVPTSGREGIFLSIAEYSREDILWVADYFRIAASPEC